MANRLLSNGEMTARYRNRGEEKNLEQKLARITKTLYNSKDVIKDEMQNWRQFVQKTSRNSGWSPMSLRPEIGEDILVPSSTSRVQGQGSPKKDGSKFQRPWAYTYSHASHNKVYKELHQSGTNSQKNFRTEMATSSFPQEDESHPRLADEVSSAASVNKVKNVWSRMSKLQSDKTSSQTAYNETSTVSELTPHTSKNLFRQVSKMQIVTQAKAAWLQKGHVNLKSDQKQGTPPKDADSPPKLKPKDRLVGNVTTIIGLNKSVEAFACSVCGSDGDQKRDETVLTSPVFSNKGVERVPPILSPNTKRTQPADLMEQEDTTELEGMPGRKKPVCKCRKLKRPSPLTTSGLPQNGRRRTVSTGSDPKSGTPTRKNKSLGKGSPLINTSFDDVINVNKPTSINTFKTAVNMRRKNNERCASMSDFDLATIETKTNVGSKEFSADFINETDKNNKNEQRVVPNDNNSGDFSLKSISDLINVDVVASSKGKNSEPSKTEVVDNLPNEKKLRRKQGNETNVIGNLVTKLTDLSLNSPSSEFRQTVSKDDGLYQTKSGVREISSVESILLKTSPAKEECDIDGSRKTIGMPCNTESINDLSRFGADRTLDQIDTSSDHSESIRAIETRCKTKDKAGDEIFDNHDKMNSRYAPLTAGEDKTSDAIKYNVKADLDNAVTFDKTESARNNSCEDSNTSNEPTQRKGSVLVRKYSLNRKLINVHKATSIIKYSNSFLRFELGRKHSIKAGHRVQEGDDVFTRIAKVLLHKVKILRRFRQLQAFRRYDGNLGRSSGAGKGSVSFTDDIIMNSAEESGENAGCGKNSDGIGWKEGQNSNSQQNRRRSVNWDKAISRATIFHNFATRKNSVNNNHINNNSNSSSARVSNDNNNDNKQNRGSCEMDDHNNTRSNTNGYLNSKDKSLGQNGNTNDDILNNNDNGQNGETKLPEIADNKPSRGLPTRRIDGTSRHGKQSIYHRGIRLTNYVHPQHRYKVVNKARASKRGLSIRWHSSVGVTVSANQYATNQELDTVFSKDARQRALVKMVELNHTQPEEEAAEVISPALRSRIEEFMISVEPFCQNH